MKNGSRRRFSGAVAGLSVLACLGSTAPPRGAAARQIQARRQQLVGTWQLVSVQIIGPTGRQDDPFYNSAPEGVLLYDASGWMSVQIVSHPRPLLQAHAARSGDLHAPEAAQIEASVLDTYYAYAGTWYYDAAASRVTHQVTMSLIPGETGKSYAQNVVLEDDRLIFRVTRSDLGNGRIQEKVWKRVGVHTE